MVEKLLRVKDLIGVLGVSRTTLYRMIVSNELPTPINLSKKIKAWKVEDINQFIEHKKATQGNAS